LAGRIQPECFFKEWPFAKARGVLILRAMSHHPLVSIGLV
jgi:hypothetical protein